MYSVSFRPVAAEYAWHMTTPPPSFMKLVNMS
jgi:hypothetical protein